MFKDGEFDAITLLYALHHTSNPEIVIGEVKRILKPDGRIVMVEYIVRKRKSKCHKFVKEEVNKMLENAEFRDIIIQKLEEDLILSIGRK
ncbi:Ubiquinone/menaquinone biosynthesis C-methyltransferase UbiE [uncultured archaeon]|nr:Ubiquinone/menaquinone biosynthesis C-methyltransferase UbiE [uncultured archaeon]